MLEKQIELAWLIYDVRKQLPTGNLVVTCNRCECGGTVVGAGQCIDCLEKKLAGLTNRKIAQEFVAASRQVQKAVVTMQNLVEL